MSSRTARATGAVTRYTYSAENQLTRIDFADGTFAAYRYDALGRRIEKRLGETSVTRFVYDAEDLLLELTQLGTVQARWTHGPGIDEPWLLERDLNQNGAFEASERFTYHTDALGSVVALTNSTGQVLERYRYGGFGSPTIRSPGADGLWETADDTALACSAYGNPFLFTGREYDCESGLYYYRARYYDPATGRFLQEDPVWSTNLYLYTDNNPSNFIDPFGLWKYYGNWGGPGWTNGSDKWTENDDFPREGEPGFVPPIDERDRAYYQHDTGLRDCATIANAESRQQCRGACDAKLVNDLKVLKGKFGNTYNDEVIFDRIKPNDNPGGYYPSNRRQ